MKMGFFSSMKNQSYEHRFPVSCWVIQAQNLSIRILFQTISWLVNAGGLIRYQCAEGWGT